MASMLTSAPATTPPTLTTIADFQTFCATLHDTVLPPFTLSPEEFAFFELQLTELGRNGFLCLMHALHNVLSSDTHFPVKDFREIVVDGKLHLNNFGTTHLERLIPKNVH